MSQLAANFDLAFPTFHLHVNIAVPAEGIIGVFGPSGSGKTTLLRCLAGLERSPTGSMALHHHIWQEESQHIFVPLSERPIGYVFQEPRLFPHLNVLANLQYGWKRTSESARRITLDQVVQVLDIERATRSSSFIFIWWRATTDGYRTCIIDQSAPLAHG